MLCKVFTAMGDHQPCIHALRRHGGFTLLETLVVMMLGTVMISIAVSNLKELDDPLQNGTAQLASFLKEARAKAISQTVAYEVSPGSSTTISTRFGSTCATATTEDPTLSLGLPPRTSLVSTNWSFCFTSRGLVDENTQIQVREGASTRVVEVMLGGAVRVQ